MGRIAEVGILVRILYEHPADEYALSHGAFAGAAGLEALPRRLAEAVQVQAVIPVGTTDQRQTVGAPMVQGVLVAAAQVLHQRLGQFMVVVEIHLLFQNGKIAGLPVIGADGGNEPQRIIVEACADVHIPLLGQRLILMVGVAILELGRCNVEDEEIVQTVLLPRRHFFSRCT